ncbi:hypothetical protein SDC9_81626 [bioreactor metagenome]|uniref:Uncharacterized protein n=1 Tax=bioreactor metagenome TaxID=1076179 RepID=A0A644Z2G0_9ZZZZ
MPLLFGSNYIFIKTITQNINATTALKIDSFFLFSLHNSQNIIVFCNAINRYKTNELIPFSILQKYNIAAIIVNIDIIPLIYFNSIHPLFYFLLYFQHYFKT